MYKSQEVQAHAFYNDVFEACMTTRQDPTYRLLDHPIQRGLETPGNVEYPNTEWFLESMPIVPTIPQWTNSLELLLLLLGQSDRHPKQHQQQEKWSRVGRRMMTTTKYEYLS
jgi:hypothetical protein